MRADLITIQQTLTPEAATVLNQSIAEATRRNHGHTTPLHVAATLLSSSSGFLRQACIKSHPNSSHPLQCRALELCFSVALERLPTTTTTTTSSPSQTQEPPPLLSNALTAALKRAQAHQRRGCPEQQQQPLLAVKVELEQLIISILDDPSVSRVMREASFSSPAVKSAIERSRFGNSRTVNQSAIGFGYRPVPVPVNRNPYLNPRFQQNEHSGQRSTDEEAKRVMEIMTRTRKRNPVLVGDSEPQALLKEILGKIENGDGPLRNFQVIRLEEELASSSTRFGEISGLVETRLGNSELTGGVVLDLGDLKWLAANGGGGGAVAEMRKLLERYKGRLCFIGTATCETYLRCQVYYPSMENDCDLQAIPIAAKSPLPTMFQRFGGSNVISTESISPTRSLQIPTGKMNCCSRCLQSYQNDVAKLEKSLTENNRSVLPQWLQNAKADDVGDKKLTKDQEIVELQKKWNDLCLRLHPKPNSRSSDITPPGSPVGTDLVLGRSNRVVSSPDTKTRDSFDIDLFKKLLKGLAKSVWWQHDAASSVASAITDRKHGNRKSKGDIWLMFTGPDKTGKTKMAAALSDLVSGSQPITISLGSGSGSGSSTDDGLNLRGKTALDRLAETVRRNPFAVIVMEDIDEADVLLRNNVKLAMERGRICDSYGREVSLGNVIIILTVNSSLGLAENAAPIDEARLESLVSKGWKLRLSVSKTRKRKPNWLYSEHAKQRKEICFDLNEEAAEFDSSSDVTVEHDQDDDSSFVHKLVALADDAIVFRPVDFGLIKSKTAESLKKRFSNAEGLAVEIEDDALERIAGAIWLSKISLEEWLDETMGSSLNSVKSRVSSLEDSVVRIELEDDVNDRVSGGYLPSSVRTLVV
ncbi:unnamed protein product [Brassica rapa]|uniref:Clp R domain-containing protein n=1 Tax=Brassica campestris TaxID=3711 RepID=A0A8D9GPR8_BRACM|nr:unnamed protein product [Brassica rapa]